VEEELGNFAAGVANTVTFGLSTEALNAIGVHPKHLLYRIPSGEISGFAVAVLIPGEGEAALGEEGIAIGVKVAGQMEGSWMGPRSRFRRRSSLVTRCRR
jgi:hypothetical protein